MRDRLKILAAAVLAASLALLFMSCVPMGSRMMADAMADIDGGPVRDATVRVLDAMADAMQPDAAAQAPEVYTGTCDQSEGSTLWSEISIPGLDPHNVVQAVVVLCDCTGTACPESVLGDRYDAVPCFASGGGGDGRGASPVLMDDGLVRVRCGSPDARYDFVRVAITQN